MSASSRRDLPSMFETMVQIAPLLPRGSWLGALILLLVFAWRQVPVVEALGAEGLVKISGGAAVGWLAFPALGAYVLGFVSLLDPGFAGARRPLALIVCLLTPLCLAQGWLFGPLAEMRAANAEALAAGLAPVWEMRWTDSVSFKMIVVPPLGLVGAMFLTRIHEAAAAQREA
ncbi:hypothetical protein [Neomegalonema sp.]|uniref:hypothetical protein n=1 Tax=Neomegalonema sp. TaxID=2039713 RepID=UPI0026156F10|nr:hypothetical protein [Neomegalonema sp.]MDD2870263.1 hypothetical protein [Neomegalonema sp.]